MPFAILGVVLSALSVVSVVGGMAHAFASGTWKDWGVLEWLANIGCICVALLPYLNVFKLGWASVAAIGGGAIKLLSKVPLLGKLAMYVAWTFDGLRKYWYLTAAVLFTKGSWLHRFGNRMADFARFLGKHPWIVFGMMFASTMFDNIIRHIFQMWGDLSLKAADFAYERLSSIMSSGGYGDPVTEAANMLDSASNSLPYCFTAIWGAVGASECIGLIIMTFQYIVLVYALSKSFAVAGVK